MRRPFQKMICFALGHLLVDPFCLPDDVVKIMHRKPAPDAVCLRCQELFMVEPVYAMFLPGCIVGWKVRRANR